MVSPNYKMCYTNDVEPAPGDIVELAHPQLRGVRCGVKVGTKALVVAFDGRFVSVLWGKNKIDEYQSYYDSVRMGYWVERFKFLGRADLSPSELAAIMMKAFYR